MVEAPTAVAAVAIREEDPGSPAARWCLARYYEELAARFEGGFDPEVAAYSGADKPGLRTSTAVAFRGDDPVGCASLTWTDLTVGEVKRMWVAPEARSLGLAGRLLAHLEDKARALGLAALRLDTNRVLTEAHALYRKAGYVEIARYSDNPYAHHWFGKTL